MSSNYCFPFTAIEAQDDFKLCLVLNLIDPTIGGVLATGDKGTGKTTTVRALSQLMGTDFPFITLPIGATEDRVLGSVNIEALINQKKTIIDKGLLAKSNNGFLYIDEVNLLNDYLMDVLLDASSSGGYHLERDGISQWLESRFCLVGTMNPEEGDLRPQLKDRFGLSVNVSTTDDLSLRTRIAHKRLEFDTDSIHFYNVYHQEEVDLKKLILNSKSNLSKTIIPERVKEAASQLSIKARVEGLRADILLLKASRAYAALTECEVVSLEMLNKIAPYVLNHRSDYQEPPESSPTNQDKHESNDESDLDGFSNTSTGESVYQLPEQVKKGLTFNIETDSKKKVFKGPKIEYLNRTPYKAKPDSTLAVLKSIKHYLATDKFKAFYNQVSNKSNPKIVFLLDASGSMAIDKQLGFIKGIVTKTIESYPNKTIEYAIVTLEHSSAKICQYFTRDKGFLDTINNTLRAGGKTNLGLGFLKVHEVLKNVNVKAVQLFVLTDGKVNFGADNPFRYAVKTYKMYLSKLTNTTIVDTENGFVKLGKAKHLAHNLKVHYTSLTAF